MTIERDGLQSFSDFVRITFDRSGTSVAAERNKHTIALLQPFKHAVIELFDQVLMFGAVDEVVHFFRVVFQVVEFIDIPDPVVMYVLVAVRTDAVRSRSMREVAFPVVFIEGTVTPGNLPALQDWQERLSVHMVGPFEPGYIHDGRSDVDVLD